MADDGVAALTCEDSVCVAGDVPVEEPRSVSVLINAKPQNVTWRCLSNSMHIFLMTQCGIHGEVCEVTGTDSSSNDCCGDVKYMCELVSISETIDDTRCCMPLGAKGCSYIYHCCGEDIGNRCEDSRCVDINGEFPDDSHGTRKVSTYNRFRCFLI